LKVLSYLQGQRILWSYPIKNRRNSNSDTMRLKNEIHREIRNYFQGVLFMIQCNFLLKKKCSTWEVVGIDFFEILTKNSLF